MDLPITLNHPKLIDYQYIINRATSKLSRWRSKFLTLAGRTTLFKSVLNSIPVYTMQTNLLPSKIIHQLKRLQRNFLLGSSAQKRKIHLINWDIITSPKSKGGLGIQKLVPKNLAMLTSLLWRYSRAIMWVEPGPKWASWVIPKWVRVSWASPKWSQTSWAFCKNHPGTGTTN